MSKRRRNQISGQFSAHLIEMLESPAYRALSLSARRVLDRVEIEHGHHGGNDNGRLPVTFNQFHEYGIHRHSIAPGIREAEALGFLETTVKGRAGNAEHRAPNMFRLTYRPSDGVPGDGTHEWRRITSTGTAEQVADAARKDKPAKKTKSQCRKTHPTSAGNHHRNDEIPVPETITTEVAKTITTSISRAGTTTAQQAREARPPGSAVASGPAAVGECSANASRALPDRPEVILQRVASRFGDTAEGYAILQQISADAVEGLIKLETKGKLTTEIIESARLETRRGAA